MEGIVRQGRAMQGNLIEGIEETRRGNEKARHGKAVEENARQGKSTERSKKRGAGLEG